LIDEEGQQVGIVNAQQALDMARSKGYDLVEVAPEARPPVCKIMDFGKFLYEQSKKAKVAKKKQHTVNLKEMRFRPKTEEHDFNFKLKHVIEFLKQGSKVKVYVEFRGREMVHKELGVNILNRVKGALAELAEPESESLMEGRRLSIVFAPKKEIISKT
jgi:translation initiation factor IF-3